MLALLAITNPLAYRLMKEAAEFRHAVLAGFEPGPRLAYHQAMINHWYPL